MKQMVKMVAESCWPQYKFAKCSLQVALLKFKKNYFGSCTCKCMKSLLMLHRTQSSHSLLSKL